MASQADLSADVVIVGSGAGGGTLAYALRRRGANVLLLERGGFMPREPANWSPASVQRDGRYRSAELRIDADGRPYWPRQYCVVGGNTTVWGACLPRLRVEDFGRLQTRDGISPAWPVTYAELEPFYTRAEAVYGVRGEPGQDPTAPIRVSSYPHRGVVHEPQIAELHSRLAQQGLHPFTLPLGINLGDGGGCVRCGTCDAYPCFISAKNDAEVRAVRPAMSTGVRLATGTVIDRLVTDKGGRRIIAAEGRRAGRRIRIVGSTFVVACGAVASAVLLLRSANATHPQGLANSSGQVGRNYMAHLLTGLLAIRARPNRIVFQKTLGVNDWYLTSPGDGRPLGNLQMIGKVVPEMLAGELRAPRALLAGVTNRSVDWIATSEDLPDPENRVTIESDGRVRVRWQPSNVDAHRELVRRGRSMLRHAGYRLVFTRRFGIANDSHQCGTLRFGDDPEGAPLDPTCKAWDHENLYVVDASFMPSSAALNPGLTIAAMALRVGALIGS